MKNLMSLIFLAGLILGPTALAGHNSNLLRAASEGKLEEVVILIEEHNYDINSQEGAFGMTPLHYALLNKNCQVAKYLTTKNARTDLIAGFHNMSAADLIQKGYCKDQL